MVPKTINPKIDPQKLALATMTDEEINHLANEAAQAKRILDELRDALMKAAKEAKDVQPKRDEIENAKLDFEARVNQLAGVVAEIVRDESLTDVWTKVYWAIDRFDSARGNFRRWVFSIRKRQNFDIFRSEKLGKDALAKFAKEPSVKKPSTNQSALLVQKLKQIFDERMVPKQFDDSDFDSTRNDSDARLASVMFTAGIKHDRLPRQMKKGELRKRIQLFPQPSKWLCQKNTARDRKAECSRQVAEQEFCSMAIQAEENPQTLADQLCKKIRNNTVKACHRGYPWLLETRLGWNHVLRRVPTIKLLQESKTIDREGIASLGDLLKSAELEDQLTILFRDMWIFYDSVIEWTALRSNWTGNYLKNDSENCFVHLSAKKDFQDRQETAERLTGLNPTQQQALLRTSDQKLANSLEFVSALIQVFRPTVELPLVKGKYSKLAKAEQS